MIDRRYKRLATPAKVASIVARVTNLLGVRASYEDKWISGKGKTYKFIFVDNREAKLGEVIAYLDTLNLPKGSVRAYLRREYSSPSRAGNTDNDNTPTNLDTIGKLLPVGETLIYSGVNLAIDFSKFEEAKTYRQDN